MSESKANLSIVQAEQSPKQNTYQPPSTHLDPNALRIPSNPRFPKTSRLEPKYKKRALSKSEIDKMGQISSLVETINVR
jgi:hypothetical protein